MMKLIMIISAVILVIGSIMIYDARKIAQKYFSFKEQNSKTKQIKIMGYVVLICGLGLMLIK